MTRKPKPIKPCATHTFRAEWEFCLVCGLYRRDIPRSKGGERDG
jgi:hypothetical protein